MLEQTGFCQVAGQVDISGRLQPVGVSLPAGRFVPAHLRSLSYVPAFDDLRLKFDAGEVKGKAVISDTGRQLRQYFLTGLAFADTAFWVNLRPDSPDAMIERGLAQTDAGRVMLEADLQLKKDTAGYTSPRTRVGKEYWNRIYAKAEELFGSTDIVIPTVTRPWIVPGEIVLRESEGNVYIYKASLKVMLEADYLKGSSAHSFTDARQRALNEYSSQLIRELIIPELRREINTSARYAALRQVYFSLILAQWFKKRYRGANGRYSRLIDQGNLSGIASRISWSPEGYFHDYQESFNSGEYNLKDTAQKISGQVVRSYCSGGISLSVAIPDSAGAYRASPQINIIFADPAKRCDRGLIPLEMEEPAAAPGPVVTIGNVNTGKHYFERLKAEAIIEKIPLAGVSREGVKEMILNAGNFGEIARQFVSWGLIAREPSRDEAERRSFVDLAADVWYALGGGLDGASIPSEAELKEGLLPSITVAQGGRTFHLYGVAHSDKFLLYAAPRFFGKLKERGELLFFEQQVRPYYEKYWWGNEIPDHIIPSQYPVLQEGIYNNLRTVFRAGGYVSAMGIVGTLLLSPTLFQVFFDALSVGVVLLVPHVAGNMFEEDQAKAIVRWNDRVSGVIAPAHKDDSIRKNRFRMRKAEWDNPEIAREWYRGVLPEHLSFDGENFVTGRPSLRLEGRSAIMAKWILDSVREEPAGREVHILTGSEHTPQIMWFLKNPGAIPAFLSRFARAEANYEKVRNRAARRANTGVDRGGAQETDAVITPARDGGRRKEEVVRAGEKISGQAGALSSGKGMPAAPGGIDFRGAAIRNAAVDVQGLFGNLPACVAGMNIDAEWSRIVTMVDRGIVPSWQRIKEYVGACYLNGSLAPRSGELLNLVVKVLRMEEAGGLPTEPVFRDLLILIEES